jgi:cytochrome bd-type quinol oxidase subunit 2
MLPPGPADSTLTFENATGDPTTLWALFIAVIVGLFVLVPSLYWLYKLTLTGEIDPNHRPIEDLEKSDDEVKPLA